ncbi:MAG: CvpA family protein [Pseudomonadales bacterium]
MPTTDIVLLIVILLSALIGLARGLLKELLSLLTWAAALGFALALGPLGADYLRDHLSDAMVRKVAAFAGIFFGTLILGGIVQWLVAKLVASTGLTGTDRVLSFVFGAGRGVLVCLVGLMALKAFAAETAWWRGSIMIPELLAFEQDLIEIFGNTMTWFEESGT